MNDGFTELWEVIKWVVAGLVAIVAEIVRRDRNEQRDRIGKLEEHMAANHGNVHQFISRAELDAHENHDEKQFDDIQGTIKELRRELSNDRREIKDDLRTILGLIQKVK